MNSRPGMLDALRRTLRQVMDQRHKTPDDHTLTEVERSLLRAIAEFEARESDSREWSNSR